MILTIDPSINTPGLALFNGTSLHSVACPINPPSYTRKKIVYKYTSIQRMQNLVCCIHDFAGFNLPKIHAVFIETPYFTFMDKNKKDMLTLTKAVGFIEGAFCETRRKVFEIPTTEWKGSETKEATIYRLNRIYPQFINELDAMKDKKHNAYDAIGIGHWVTSDPRYFEITRRI